VRRNVDLDDPAFAGWLIAWSKSAITSLAVPLSPVMRIVTSLGAMRSTVRTASCHRRTAETPVKCLPLMVSSARRRALFPASAVCGQSRT